MKILIFLIAFVQLGKSDTISLGMNTYGNDCSNLPKPVGFLDVELNTCIIDEESQTSEFLSCIDENTISVKNYDDLNCESSYTESVLENDVCIDDSNGGVASFISYTWTGSCSNQDQSLDTLDWIPQSGCWHKPGGSFLGSCPQCWQNYCFLQCNCFTGEGTHTRYSELDIKKCFYEQYIDNSHGYLQCSKKSMTGTMTKTEIDVDESLVFENHQVVVETPEFDENEFSLIMRVNRQTFSINRLEQIINVFYPTIAHIEIMQNPKNQVCSITDYDDEDKNDYKITIQCEKFGEPTIVSGFVHGLEDGETIIVRSGTVLQNYVEKEISNGEFSMEYLENELNLQVWKHPMNKECTITNVEENIIECTSYEKSFGYAMCSSAKLFRFALARAKKIAGEDTPVYICHIDELSQGQLDSLPENAYGLNLVPFLEENQIISSEEEKLKFEGFPCKPMCMLAIQKEIVVLMDTDALFLTEPLELTQYDNFRTNGAIFMNDQEQFDENKLSTFLFNVLPTLTDEIDESIYEHLRNHYINAKWSQWKGESALMAIDKTNHEATMDWLMWLHEPSQIDYYYKYAHGDKESFWIACVLAQDNCPFNQWAVAVGGVACEDHGIKGTTMSDNAIVQYHPYEIRNPSVLYINGDLIADIVSNETPLDRMSLMSPPKLYFEKPEWIFHKPSLDMVCLEGQMETAKSQTALETQRKEFLDHLSSCESHNDCESFEFCMNCEACLQKKTEFGLQGRQFNCFGCGQKNELYQCAPLEGCQAHREIAVDTCPDDCSITKCPDYGYCSSTTYACHEHVECCVWNDNIDGKCSANCPTEDSFYSNIASFRKQVDSSNPYGPIKNSKILKRRRELTSSQRTMTVVIGSSNTHDFLCSQITNALSTFVTEFGGSASDSSVYCAAQGYANYTYTGNITNITGFSNSSAITLNDTTGIYWNTTGIYWNTTGIYWNSTNLTATENTTVGNYTGDIGDDILTELSICSPTGVVGSLTNCGAHLLRTVRNDEWVWYINYTLSEDNDVALFADYYDPIAQKIIDAETTITAITLQNEWLSAEIGALEVVYDISDSFVLSDHDTWFNTQFGNYDVLITIFNPTTTTAVPTTTTNIPTTTTTTTTTAPGTTTTTTTAPATTTTTTTAPATTTTTTTPPTTTVAETTSATTVEETTTVAETTSATTVEETTSTTTEEEATTVGAITTEEVFGEMEVVIEVRFNMNVEDFMASIDTIKLGYAQALNVNVLKVEITNIQEIEISRRRLATAVMADVVITAESVEELAELYEVVESPTFDEDAVTAIQEIDPENTALQTLTVTSIVLSSTTTTVETTSASTTAEEETTTFAPEGTTSGPSTTESLTDFVTDTAQANMGMVIGIIVGGLVFAGLAGFGAYKIFCSGGQKPATTTRIDVAEGDHIELPVMKDFKEGTKVQLRKDWERYDLMEQNNGVVKGNNGKTISVKFDGRQSVLEFDNANMLLLEGREHLV